MYNLFSSQNVYLLVLLAVWEMVWKGLALWRAARNGQQLWFVVLLVINSLGILPILYIRFFQKKRDKQEKSIV